MGTKRGFSRLVGGRQWSIVVARVRGQRSEGGRPIYCATSRHRSCDHAPLLLSAEVLWRGPALKSARKRSRELRCRVGGLPRSGRTERKLTSASPRGLALPKPPRRRPSSRACCRNLRAGGPIASRGLPQRRGTEARSLLYRDGFGSHSVSFERCLGPSSPRAL